jgi:hypothetical protein
MLLLCALTVVHLLYRKLQVRAMSNDVSNLGRPCKNDVDGITTAVGLSLWHRAMGLCCPMYQFFNGQLLTDLSAASVRFVNGTTSDLVLAHGGEECLQAMVRSQQLDTTILTGRF